MGRRRRVGGCWRLWASVALLAGACGGDGSATDGGSGEAFVPWDAGPCVTDAGPIDCSHLGTPCNPGACNPTTGACEVVVIDDGVPCDDGNPCTERGYCDMGACVSEPRDCSAQATPCADASCDPAMGGCVRVPIAEGMSCDDGSVCTTASQCTDGTCAPTAFLDCSAVADACNAPSCDAMGGCVARPIVDAPCDDGDACTSGDRCDATGTCVGTAPGCAALAGPCRRGTCDAVTGGCVFTPLPAGSTCDDGDTCTSSDRCTASGCAGTPIACSGGDACHVAACDPAAGCTVTTRSDGSGCDDGNACTWADQCTAGRCAGTLLLCTPLDDACNTGACDPGTGVCRRVPRPDGTDCDTDPSDCTVDRCAAGACAPVNVADCSTCGGLASGLLCRSGSCEVDPITQAEGFEGTGLPAGYTTGAGVAGGGWAQTSTMSVEGAQSIRSDTIAHGQRSDVSRTVFSTWLLRVSFAFRVSTEESTPLRSGDALIFLVDDVEVARWSGVRAWGRFSHDLWQPGPHVLTWRYKKDAAGTAGTDAVFVDDVRLSGLASEVEDFEGGTMPAAFSTSSTQPWRVTPGGASSSAFGAQSGSLTGSWLRYTVAGGRGATVGYAARTQLGLGEALVVLLDGTEVQRFTGIRPWASWGQTVPAGTHTMEWRVELGPGPPGSAWIDNVLVVPDPCP